MKKTPLVKTALPGPRAKALIKLDKIYVSPSYTRVYPLVAEKAEGLWVQDVDGNVFLDFTAGIAVNSTGHCHPQVVKAIQRQAEKLLHMSGTDFYYKPQIMLAEKLGSLAPGKRKKRYGKNFAQHVISFLMHRKFISMTSKSKDRRILKKRKSSVSSLKHSKIFRRMNNIKQLDRCRKSGRKSDPDQGKWSKKYGSGLENP